MSISSEIIRLANIREDMKTLLVGKGITVPDWVQYDEIAPLIDLISIWFPNGTEWTRAGTSADASTTIAYRKGVFTIGKYYSLDGKSWHRCYLDSGEPCDGTHAIYYNRGGVFICYESTTIYYSEDGITWKVAYEANNEVRQLCGDAKGTGNLCVIADGYLLYTSDGKMWTQNTSINGANLLFYGADGKFLCASSGRHYLQYSTNGITWNDCTGINAIVDPNQNDYTSGEVDYCQYTNDARTGWVCGIPEIEGGYSGEDDRGGVYFSTNGTTWTKIEEPDSNGVISPLTDFPYYETVYYNGLYVRQNAKYSTNNSSWTACTNLNTGNIIRAACGIWISGGANQSVYSLDGKTWVSNGLEYPVYDIAYANGIWVASTTRGMCYSVAWEG